ncbi:MFS transporter [Streptomyces albipurpureus]|uniref:MFS transporter n=1 Tax=Streptomyces albipurpureus TaxID=2897419 RepID=A0ABT0UPX5_9ACTN|nr:MFS transporter [Streptomyces sp. CWNU-1]MCM2390588.1 MFS transporter [Streptomyces sp. CWNU-1]
MPFLPSPAPTRSAAPTVQVRRLERKLLVYAGLDDLILLYPVYAVLFTDHGLSTAEISSLFVVGSLTGILLEVPSGVWADTVSRRRVLVVGPLLSAVGFALWVTLPGYASFALGMVLWSGGGALRSGSMEALAYEELERLGAANRYVRLMGRAATASTTATALAIAAAGPSTAWGGYGLLGAASVMVCVLCSLSALALPEHRPRNSEAAWGPQPQVDGPAVPVDRAAADRAACPSSGVDRSKEHGGESDTGILATLRTGLDEVRASKRVRYALFLAVLLTSIWGALEEFVPLLAGETGVATRDVPWLVLTVWVGVSLGGLLTAPAERLPAHVLGAVLAVAAALMAVSTLSGEPVGFVLLGLAFLVFQLTDVVGDARLQSAITGTSRATVTSLAGLGTSVTTLLVYAVYGAAAGLLTHGQLFALFALPYLGVAYVLARARRLHTP